MELIKSRKRTLLVTCTLCMLAANTWAQTWNFTTVDQQDLNNLKADNKNWTAEVTSSNNRYKNATAYNDEELTANGQTLNCTKDLHFTASNADAIRIDIKGKRVAFNKPLTVRITDLKAGQKITMKCKSSSSSTARGINTTNLTPTSGYFNQTSTDDQINIATVNADGDITLSNTGGMYVYSIDIQEKGAINPNEYHSVAQNKLKNQICLTVNNNPVYYNTEDIKVNIDKETGTLTVSAQQGNWTDVYDSNVTHIGFIKSNIKQDYGTFNNTDSQVNLTLAQGWMQTAYITWKTFSKNGTDAESYHVYVKGDNDADFTRIDQELTRNYGSEGGRADAVGLKAGNYQMKVVPVFNGTEDTDAANTASNIIVKKHDRTGFAFNNGKLPGAYKADGTLKDNVVVLYITEATKDNIKLSVTTNSKGSKTDCTGWQNILNAIKKGYDNRAFCFRLIGQITDPAVNDKGDICIDMNNRTTCAGLTVEGIGNDAVADGWGIRVKGASCVEISNLAFMNCNSSEGDNVGLQQDNNYIWVHNCDMFYGNAGSDADQIKGDGALDCKKSNYVTFSYNHFWDNGKCNLLGLSEKSTDLYITYHHNWYDHSDSRHPRVRYYSAHVYNNYYDGNAKYGIGTSEQSSVFAENNYFRAVAKPILTNHQGTDAMGDGTFDDPNGGITKACGNVFTEKPANFSFITQKDNATSFDAYVVDNPTDLIPNTVKSLVGNSPYSYFDTNAQLMYTYKAESATDVPATVTGQYGAGRIQHGDFQWTFNNAVDDASYTVNKELKVAVTIYKTKLLGIYP